jgi:hypothetical protein
MESMYYKLNVGNAVMVVYCHHRRRRHHHHPSRIAANFWLSITVVHMPQGIYYTIFSTKSLPALP